MNLLKYLYQQSWRLFVAGMVAALLSGICAAALVAVINEGMTATTGLAPFAWAFFGLCLAYLGAKSASEIALLHLTQGTIERLRLHLGEKVLATSPARLQRLGKPALQAILTKDIDTFTSAFQVLPLAIGNGIIIVVCLAYMALMSWQLFLVFTATLLVCLAGFHFAEQRPLRQLVLVRDKLDAVYRHLRGLIEGSRELQLNAGRGRQFLDDVLAPSTGELKRLSVQALGGYVWILNVGTILFYLVIGINLFIVPLFLPQALSTRIGMTLVLLYLIRPISDMMNVFPTLRQAGVALAKIQQLQQDLNATPRHDAPSPFDNTAPFSLELRGVCHHYPGRSEDTPFMLGPVNLRVREGEIVFIVGGNGSGKTTLAMLLLGLYEPEQGDVRLNGVAVTPANLVQYRQHFSAVFADFHLFEHLLGANDSELAARATRYIKLFDMDHKVQVQDGKFSTTELSTGQRKRLALVSAYLEDRPVYLFDEWAADQDPVFKRVFYTELLPDLKARGKTVLVITHDDGYFSYADRVVKVADGQLTPLAAQPRPQAMAASAV